MPGEGAADQHFEPFPIAFCTGNRMESDQAATGLDVSSESQSLVVRREHTIIGAGKNQQGVFFQVLFSEYAWVIAHCDVELFLNGQFLHGLHGRRDVVMYKACAVFGVDKDIGVLQRFRL